MKTLHLLFVIGAVTAVIFVSSCGKKTDTTQDQTKKQADSLKVVDTSNTSNNSINNYLIAGYMYWTPPAIIDTPWTAVITGQIISLEDTKKKAGDPEKGEVFGLVQIDKVLLSNPAGEKNIASEQFVRTDALKGFKPGDKVIIYFVTYDKEYAIKRGNVKKITGPDDELVGLTERYIKNGQDPEYILKDDAEYKLWGKYDVGTASRLMQEREEKQNGDKAK
jgi:hypothetical protein